MIDGLNTAFTGEEIIRSLDSRIESERAEIQFRRDGRKDLRQAGLMPRHSKQIRELDPEKGIRWVTRAVR